jgi:hypothetical protein
VSLLNAYSTPQKHPPAKYVVSTITSLLSSVFETKIGCDSAVMGRLEYYSDVMGRLGYGSAVMRRHGYEPAVIGRHGSDCVDASLVGSGFYVVLSSFGFDCVSTYAFFVVSTTTLAAVIFLKRQFKLSLI